MLNISNIGARGIPQADPDYGTEKIIETTGDSKVWGPRVT